MTALETLTKGLIKNHTPPNNQTSRANTDMPMNERITEGIVRDILKSNQKKYPKTTVEEQQSTNPRIRKLLQHASKSGLGGGSPEFIITFENIPDLVIVIECKADIKKHKSKNGNKPKDYAVDGVLLYSQYLAKEFDVVSIAVSGQKESDLKVSTFLQLKSQKPIDKPDKEILDFESYVSLYTQDPEKEKKDLSDLLQFSKKLHDDLRDRAKLIESEKPLFVSAVLLALKESTFVSSYAQEQNPTDLATSLVNTVTKSLRNVALQSKKIEAIEHSYDSIKFHPVLINKKSSDGKPSHLLRSLIQDIEHNVMPFIQNHKYDDVIGMFFAEFLRYTGGEKKGLGIVLTPKHITELFTDIANIDKNDIVFDNCCGTGGFLISAMKKMIEGAGNDMDKIQNIQHNQLIGVESLPKMFALSCANMILRNDGKTNLYREDCFSMANKIKKHNPTIGLLNPPYSQNEQHELDFVLNCLDCLEKNGLCVAIVPISCATTPTEQKIKLLENHTLEAVMSMPTNLFHPIGTVTCVMVFRAHVSHDSTRKTWFGFWKMDGFEKTKHNGRVDSNGTWTEIKEKWLDNYRNRKKIAGECVLQNVTAQDEWVAEAYLETDYSNINESIFIDAVKDYTIFKFKHEKLAGN